MTVFDGAVGVVGVVMGVQIDSLHTNLRFLIYQLKDTNSFSAPDSTVTPVITTYVFSCTLEIADKNELTTPLHHEMS